MLRKIFKPKGLVLLFLFLGTLVKAVYFLVPLNSSVSVTPDEAVYGIQAINITEGARPVFYRAQPYTGTPSAYLSAFLFSLFGVSRFLLKLVPFLASTFFLFTNYLLAKKIFNSQKIGLVALFISALGSPFWNNWSSRAGSGYPEAILLGNLTLLLTLGLLWPKGEGISIKKDLFLSLLLGLLSGFGFWVHPVIVYYALPAFFALSWHHLKNKKIKQGLGRAMAGVFGLLVGALPVIVYNINSTSSTSKALIKSPWGEKDALLGLVTKSFPILLGTRTSWSTENFFTPLAILVWLVFISALAYFTYQVILDHLKRSKAKFKLGLSLKKKDILLCFFLTTTAVFILSGNFGQLFLEPRYVLAMYTAIPLILAYFLVNVEKLWGRALFLIFTVIFGANFIVGYLTAPPSSFVDPYRLQEVLAELKTQDIHCVKTTGELAHRLMFMSQKDIIAKVSEGGMMAQRFPEFQDQVDAASQDKVAYVIRKDQQDNDYLKKEAENKGLRPVELEKFLIYLPKK